MSQQRVEEAADEQRVLEVVDLLEQPWRKRTFAVGEVSAARAIPDVPLVERQPQSFRRFLQALDVVGDGGDLVDLPLHVQVHREESRALVARQFLVFP